MLNRFFGINTHAYLLTFGLCVLAIGVPLNKVVMSVTMMFLALIFLLEGEYKSKIQRLVSNKSFLLLAAFFLLHIIGLLWTTDTAYAWHDIRVKLPLIIIPIIIIAKPPKNVQHINYILLAFIASTFITSIINFAFYQNWVGSREYENIRELSLFGSHIRYGVIISMSIAILLSFLKYKKYRWLILLLIVWFTFYSFYSQVLSGVITLFIVFTFYSFLLIWKKWKIVAVSYIGFIFIGTLSILIWIFKPIHINKADYQNLPITTSEGNLYSHNFDKITVETKEPTNIYVCEFELQRDWPKLSNLPLDSLDLAGQPLKKTLIRYLSSKKLNKDAEGLKQLTKKEIREVEMGHASVYDEGIMARIYGIKHQLNNISSPNNHSILERLEYWKVGVSILKKNWLIGVGTGDIQNAFTEEYENLNTLLTLENRHRTHNMYLTVFITFGIGGLIIFCWMIINFLLFNIKHKQLIGVLFILISIVSFIPEDSLETQTGVTFFALFYGLYSIAYTSLTRVE